MERKKERTAAHPSGRDYQGRHPALHRLVRNGRSESFGRVAPDASRHPSGAQAPIDRHVPEAVPPVWRHTAVVDAVAGSLRPEEGEQNKNVMERVARIVPVKPV